MTTRRYAKVLPRRTLLRGAGSVAIALPFLEEMTTRSVWAEPPAPPVRAINCFFGLGVPKEIVAEGLVGPLAPLQAVAEKISVLRGVDLFEADGPENNHFDGGGAAFTAAMPQTDSQAGGPSLDQVIMNGLHPRGPDTLVSTLMMGSFFRRKRENDLAMTRFVHCWNADGTPVDLPIETPAALFERIFGKGPVGDTPEDIKARHYERSVLDGIIEQYEHFQSDASGLGTSSRARIADHLDKIRELEKKLFPEGFTCEVPLHPGDMPLLHGQEKDAGGGGPVLLVDEWVPLWETMADLYALALQCDVTRFGQVMFQSAGERIHLDGAWDYAGQQIQFDDMADLIGAAGTHEYWHSYNASQPNEQMRWHTHFIMSQLVYFMQRLDDPGYVDENGQTLLDNALLTITTELGDGAPHDMENVFHAISGANGRFRTGETLEVGTTGTTLYTTLAQAHGVDDIVGTPSAFQGTLDAILA